MNSYTDQDNVTSEKSEYWNAHYIYGGAYHVVTTLQITLTTNVLKEEYWPSPILKNTLASYEHDYVHCQCDTGSENSVCWMQYRYIPLRKSTFIF